MGSVADKTARKFASLHSSKVVDLAGWQEGRNMALEAAFGDGGLARSKFEGHDP